MANAQTLVWDPNPEPDVAGYRLFYGTQSGNYSNQINVGLQTQYTPPSGFDWSRRLYFAVQAYNSSGLSSPLSAEVVWVPEAPASLVSLVASAGYPLQAGQPVTWTATAAPNPAALEYRFYMYRRTAWVLVQDYGPSNTFTWTPGSADNGGPYAIQVWVRRVGSTALYEGWLGTPNFSVNGAALDLSADVDFPTPPGNQVTWTARATFPYDGTLEYQFLAAEQSSGAFSIFRAYAASPQAQWTAPAIGRYAIQVRARRIGSTAAFEYSGTSAWFDVAQSALSVTGLTADVTLPSLTGTRITWTARARGGTSGPLQYQFWLHTTGTGWRLVQPYGSSPTFAWTPTWAEAGEHAVQVWVRNNGSTASYEAWRSSATFRIDRAPLSLTTPTLFPAAPGSHVDWTVAAGDGTAGLEYQFWIHSAATGQWTLGRSYAASPTFRWIPGTVGQYSIQAWARRPASGVEYEAWRTAGPLEIAQGPAQIVSLTSSVSLPVTPGTSVTWTAAAQGGTAGPLQYQFWRRSNGIWVLAQSYSALNTYTWTPTAGDVGEHELQVWVRSAGSTASYESFRSTGTFRVNQP